MSGDTVLSMSADAPGEGAEEEEPEAGIAATGAEDTTAAVTFGVNPRVGVDVCIGDAVLPIVGAGG